MSCFCTLNCTMFVRFSCSEKYKCGTSHKHLIAIMVCPVTLPCLWCCLILFLHSEHQWYICVCSYIYNYTQFTKRTQV
jgi:hypothetical protein